MIYLCINKFPLQYLDHYEHDDEEHEFNNGEGVTDIGGMALLEFIEHTRSKGRRGLYDEYQEIKSCTGPRSKEEFERLFHTCCQFENISRNRYTDVHCYDHSRVSLGQSTTNAKGANNAKEQNIANDYINANFVDGYRQSNAFIFTQGPLNQTFSHFWQMIWEQKVLVIVMTTRTVEKHKNKCGQYWPDDVGSAPLGMLDVNISNS